MKILGMFVACILLSGCALPPDCRSFSLINISLQIGGEHTVTEPETFNYMSGTNIHQEHTFPISKATEAGTKAALQ